MGVQAQTRHQTLIEVFGPPSTGAQSLALHLHWIHPPLHTKHMTGTIPRRQDLEAISCNVCPSCQDVGIGKHETSISVAPCVSTLSQLAVTHVTSSPRASPLHLRSANHESWRRQGPRNKAVNVALKWHVMALGKRPSHTRSRSWH